MDAKIKLVVGLGNPGQDYEKTRHNAGVWYVEQLARQFNMTLTPQERFWGRIAHIQQQDMNIRLLIPTTFMNESGKSVSTVAHFFKVTPEEILVAHDEMALAPGIVKLKCGGGHAGHNGLKSVIASLGQQKGFCRLRIGIGHPGDKNKVTRFVLGKAPCHERQLIDSAIEQALETTDLLFRQGVLAAMNYLHTPK